MEANSMEPDQADLGPYLLQYRLPSASAHVKADHIFVNDR